MTPDEVWANIERLTPDRVGPRGAPCDQLVLSGVPEPEAAALASVVRRARAVGVQRVTLHLGRGLGLLDSPLGVEADVRSVVVRTVDEALALGARASRIDVVVPLSHDGVAALPAIAAALAPLSPRRLVLTWPLVDDDPPPRAAVAVAAIASVAPSLIRAGVEVGVKGIPACLLAGAAPSWRSANRVYVDADHQGAAALLFFPDVVRFRKEDVCRFCDASPRCDGVPAAWADLGLHGALAPITSG